MKPGRELDAFVAEEVMGMPKPEWKPTHDEVGGAYVSSGPDPEWYSWPWEIRYWGTDRPIEWEPKRFSTDIAVAWPVAEKAFRDWAIGPREEHGSRYYRVIVNNDPDTWEPGEPVKFCQNGDTAPHAICLAALRAVRPRS